MDGLSAIIAINLDIGIKNRKKKKFNGKHQFKNPFPDNSFEYPEVCLKNHQGKMKNFQCMQVTREDALNFRNYLYETDEKRDQNDFLYSYIAPESCKTGVSTYKGKKMLMVHYHIRKLSGDSIQVCREMFRSITGFGNSRCKKIFLKRYKSELLQHGDESIMQPKNKNYKGEEIVRAKKERLLNLEKGTFETFTKAVTGILDESPIPDIETNENHMNSPKKSCRTRFSKIQSIQEDDLRFEDHFQLPEPKRINLDLKSMDVCRVCLQNDRNMFHIFKKQNSEDYTPAELMDYCLSFNVDPHDKLPKKICNSCLENVKIACNLKSEWTESQKIIEQSQQYSEEYVVPEFDEVLQVYSDEEEETVLKEEVEINLITQIDAADYQIECQELIEYEEIPVKFEKDSENDSESDLEQVTSNNPVKDSEEEKLMLYPRMCYLCNVNFETTAEDHFRNNHPLVKAERCDKCLFECDYPWFLNLHIQVHLDDYKLCPYCGVKFQVESAVFSSHKMRCSGKEQQRSMLRKYTCEYCSKVFNRRGRYLCHVRKEHTYERPYKCTECDQSFLESIHLRRHLFKHGIGATCHCENCGKPFLQRYELTRHQKNCLKKELAVSQKFETNQMIQ